MAGVIGVGVDRGEEVEAVGEAAVGTSAAVIVVVPEAAEGAAGTSVAVEDTTMLITQNLLASAPGWPRCPCAKSSLPWHAKRWSLLQAGPARSKHSASASRFSSAQTSSNWTRATCARPPTTMTYGLVLSRARFKHRERGASHAGLEGRVGRARCLSC